MVLAKEFIYFFFPRNGTAKCFFGGKYIKRDFFKPTLVNSYLLYFSFKENQSYHWICSSLVNWYRWLVSHRCDGERLSTISVLLFGLMAQHLIWTIACLHGPLPQKKKKSSKQSHFNDFYHLLTERNHMIRTLIWETSLQDTFLC